MSNVIKTSFRAPPKRRYGEPEPPPPPPPPPQIGRIVSVRAWCAERALPYATVAPSRVGCYFAPSYDPIPRVCASTQVMQPETYLAQIPNAHVFGGSEAVVVGDTMLLDAAVNGSDRFASDMPKRGSVTRTFSTGVLLTSRCSGNYFHWLVEQVSRLSMDMPAAPLLVDQIVSGNRNLMMALRMYTDREVITLERDREYEVERLILPSRLAWMPPDMKPGTEPRAGDVLISADAINYLRRGAGRPKRLLYVYRNASTAPVRLMNKDAVRNVFREAGFAVVEPEALSLDAQVRLFSDAKVVAGESGAGLTNMLWAPTEAVLICLTAKEYPLSVYADTTGHAGQRATFLVGQPDRDDYRQVPFRMDTITLAKQLKVVMGNV